MVAGVGPHAAAAEGGSERGIVNADDGLEARFPILAKDDLLVIALADLVE